jgi:hypothetical protein
MGFFSDLFGGPSSQEKNLASRESNLAATMNQDFNQRFAGQSQVLQNLTGQLTPIAELGPNQQGFSAPELAAMNTQAINASAAATRNAQQTVGATLAGRGGGGGSGLVSGIDAQIRGSIASAGANELAGAQNEITQRNYETGRKNFWSATAGEDALAKAYNPAEYGSMASSTTQLALGDEQKIQAEKRAAAFAPLSLGMKALGGVASFATGGLSNLGGAGSGSSFGENVGNFFSGGFNALAGE